MMAPASTLSQFLTGQSDFLAFATVVLVAAAALHLGVWRNTLRPLAVAVVWGLVVAVLLGGGFLVNRAAWFEWQMMRDMVQGYAPTFAAEMERLRHEEITVKTSPDSPHYFQLIQAQKRWLKANPSISDVYTLRKTGEGSYALIVDSETDYNHNGIIEGEQERRTAIGEAYRSELTALIPEVYEGKTVFLDKPYTDRWGTWVTSMVPLRNFKGKVDAVLAVDFDAAKWIAAVQRVRRVSMGGVGVVLLIILSATTVLAREAKTRQLRGQIHEQRLARIEKQKLETLINSIDGIVWEADASTGRFSFVSQQCERLLGYTPQQWLAKADFWASKLHPEDSWAREHSARMVKSGEPYSSDYRMIAADGRTVWIRENAAVLLDQSGKPLLARGVLYDVTAQKAAAAELEKANAALVDSSRFAGMAEVATGVLHNVGNVLNSVNVSGNVISERLRRSKSIELSKVASLLTLQANDFIGFVTRDPRGPHIPELISCVADALKAEHAELLEEVESITKNIGHIKEIVSMQQGFAKGGGIVEAITIQGLVDDAIKINSVSLTRHRINVVQAYEETPQVLVDKHLVLQILVNLLRNAQQAIEGSGIEPRRIVVRIQNNGPELVKVSVQDSGTGIAADNLTRIFSHGFTTKKTGHGFGLHSSALAAKGMGGSLHAHSDGPGTGATFTLELPVFQAAPVAVAA